MKSLRLAVALGFALLVGGYPRSALAQTVTVDAQVFKQTMEGFGHSARYFDDPHLLGGPDRATTPGGGLVMTTAQENDVLDKLYVDLRLNRVRPHINALIEPINDNGDPSVTDLTKFNFDWLRNDAQIDYVKRARPRGATNSFLSPTWLEPWMNESTPPAEYVEWAMAILRRWRSQGLEMPYWSIVNELTSRTTVLSAPSRQFRNVEPT